MTFEKDVKGGEAGSHVDIWGCTFHAEGKAPAKALGQEPKKKKAQNKENQKYLKNKKRKN